MSEKIEITDPRNIQESIEFLEDHDQFFKVRLVKTLVAERDEAREECRKLRQRYDDERPFPWEQKDEL